MSKVDPFLQGDYMDGVVGYFGSVTGTEAFFFVFFGVTFLGLYNATDSVMLPVVVLIVLAPLVAGLLPAIGIQFVTVVLLTMLSIGGYWLFRALDV